MKNVSKHIVLVILFIFPTILLAQSSTDKLKKERDRLEKNISNTKSLLEKTKSTTEVTLNELKLIDNQVKFREELLQNFDNQIRGTELKIEQKNMQIEELETKLKSLKIQYKKLVIYAYKKRSKAGQMMFLFSSTSYYEALKRKKYLDKIAEIQRKQKLIILQHKKLIAREKGELVEEKTYKEKIADEKRVEKDEILKDKDKQAKTLTKLKQEESKLIAQMKKDELKKQEIKRKIDQIIQADIAKNSAKTSKTAKTSKSGDKKPKSGTTSGSNTKTKPDKEITFSEPKDVALNSNFESNKGKLPWPVTTGSITEGFGKNAHPSIPNIFTNNNGVDFSTNKGAQVRAVFEGEVTTVINIVGAGKTIIIKHGNYRTVYSNLQDVYVTKGDKVNTKQSIGSLLPPDSGSLSVLHFEVRQDVTVLNPSLWITR
ncbi:MAG: murein hydrolase activator EnvC family protein [Flavobacteriia bacterium]